MICKHCKVVVDGTTCPYCGSSDLIDDTNRFVNYDVVLYGFKYDAKSRYIFMVFDYNGERQSLRVTKNKMLYAVPIKNMNNIILKYIGSDYKTYNKLNEKYFIGKNIELTITVDVLFDVITNIMSSLTNNQNIFPFIEKITSYGATYDSNGDLYMLDIGKNVNIVIRYLTAYSKKTVQVSLMKVYDDGTMIELYSTGGVGKRITKSNPTFIEELEKYIDVLKETGVDVFDEIEFNAKSIEITDEYVSMVMGALIDDGTVTGFMYSNVENDIEMASTMYDLAQAIRKMQLFTSGIASKYNLSYKAGQILLGIAVFRRFI